MSRRIFVGLMAALIVALGTPGSAGAKRTIALLEIEGARTDKLRNSIRKLIAKKHKVIDEETYARAAKRLKAKKLNPAHIREVCEYLEVDGVIDGSIVAIEGGYRLILRLHDGVTGKREWRQKLKLRKQALSKSIRPKLKKRILREIAKLGKDEFDEDDDEDDEADDDDDEADDDDEERETAKERRRRKRREVKKRKKERRLAKLERKKERAERKKERERAERKKERAARKKAARKKAARKKERERERKRKKKKKKTEEVDVDDDDDDFDDDDSDDDDSDDDDFDDDDDQVSAADDDDDDDDFEEDPLMTGKSSETASFEADPRERPLTVWLGGSATGRKLQFNFSGLVGAQRPPRYRGTPVPGIYLAGELFPMTFSPGPSSPLRNIGFGFVFDRVLKLNSAVLDTDGNALADVKTTQQRVGISVKYRHFLSDSPSQPSVVVTAGYNQSKFELDKDGVAMGTVIDVPNTTYTYLDPGVGFRMKVAGPITISAEVHALLVLDAGEIQDPDQYGAATITGVEGDIAVDYQINRKFSVRVGFHGMTLGYAFKEDTGELQDRNGDGSPDVGGARDNWYGGYLAAGYSY